MSGCSTQAMAPKEPPKTCGTCANFVKEPYKQHAGACMASYKHCPVNGYLCVSDMWPCERTDLYIQREDTLEQRCQQLELVAKELYTELKVHMIDEMVSRCATPKEASDRTRFCLSNQRYRLEALGVSVDD